MGQVRLLEKITLRHISLFSVMKCHAYHAHAIAAPSAPFVRVRSGIVFSTHIYPEHISIVLDTSITFIFIRYTVHVYTRCYIIETCCTPGKPVRKDDNLSQVIPDFQSTTSAAAPTALQSQHSEEPLQLNPFFSLSNNTQNSLIVRKAFSHKRSCEVISSSSRPKCRLPLCFSSSIRASMERLVYAATRAQVFLGSKTIHNLYSRPSSPRSFSTQL